MKRDPDLIRAMMMQIADAPPSNAGLEFDLPEWSDEEIYYHATLLIDAGFVFKELLPQTMFGVSFFPDALTHSGNDFLDAIRDNKVWVQLKEALKQTGGTASLETMKKVASSIALKMLGLS